MTSVWLAGAETPPLVSRLFTVKVWVVPHASPDTV